MADGTQTDAGRADRAGRFMARLDAYLRTLADDAARRAFLDRQLAGWEHRYARFAATAGASERVHDRADPPQAADFLITITALAARLSALGEHGRSPDMTDDRTPERRAGAFLSLLVAADQRCPAIIGQAHLLYHARPALEPRRAEQTFRQLKRDVADLVAAIAEAEAALATQRFDAR